MCEDEPSRKRERATKSPAVELPALSRQAKAKANALRALCRGLAYRHSRMEQQARASAVMGRGGAAQFGIVAVSPRPGLVCAAPPGRRDAVGLF
mmetsp:Transcript_109441/g.304495  ORF Transcript_109441/g.304495 Transcript_109441/m.304495 type:complete len:94 (+) Transcript_109441:835-1116(+)